MQSPTLNGNRPPTLVSHTHYCVMGDVSVANSAAIAPGVVLQASPGSRIVIAEGACLAGGVCVQSRQGVLTIGSGANLGANVLVIGNGAIGENACISPGSTLTNPHVDSGAIIPPGSLVSSSLVTTQQAAPTSHYASNNSQQNNTHHNNSHNGSAFNGNGFAASNGFASGSYISNPAGFAYSSSAPQPPSQPASQNGASDDTYRNTYVEPPPVGPRPIETPSLSDQNGQYVDPSSQSDGVQFSGNRPNNNANSSALTVQSNDRVYGKDQVSQLLSTLFPHR